MSMRVLEWLKKRCIFEHPPMMFVEPEKSKVELNIIVARSYLRDIKTLETKRNSYIKSISRWNNWDCSRDPFSEKELSIIKDLTKKWSDTIGKFNNWLDSDPDFGEPPPQDLMCLYQKA